MLREVLALPRDWTLKMQSDDAEPRFVSPGGAVYRPDQLRFRLERHFIYPALNQEENRLILLGRGHVEDYAFWCIRRARLWLEWNPETKSWDEYATQLEGV